MGLTRMVLVVLMLGLLAFLVTLTFRSRRVVPADLAMERALRRTNTTTAIAALGGLGFAAWGWSSFPTVYVSATEVPGLLAALGPALAGLVFLAVTAAGESTWPRPAGSYRAAHLERRPLFSRPQSWAARALWTWTALLAALLVLFGAIAEPDGRSIAHGPGVGECLADGVPVPCGGGASGPFPVGPTGSRCCSAPPSSWPPPSGSSTSSPAAPPSGAPPPTTTRCCARSRRHGWCAAPSSRRGRRWRG